MKLADEILLSLCEQGKAPVKYIGWQLSPDDTYNGGFPLVNLLRDEEGGRPKNSTVAFNPDKHQIVHNQAKYMMDAEKANKENGDGHK